MTHLSPDAVALRFIDCINRNDIEGLAALMTDDHKLVIFDEAPVRGREQNKEAWNGYATSFPDYVIYPHRLAERHGQVAILGHTTGSHLGLPDDEESKLTLIWIAGIEGDKLSSWTLIADNPQNRQAWGL
jgi:ketosteroid isomerase-like protein